MKNFIKKIIGWEINMKLLSICSLLLLIALSIPIARIMMYCVPWYDDFSYGYLTKSF